MQNIPPFKECRAWFRPVSHPSTWEAAAEVQVQGQPGLRSKFKASLPVLHNSIFKETTLQRHKSQRDRLGQKEGGARWGLLSW